jgi:hypothetical protein
MVIFALYVVVVPEQILLGSIWRTLKGFVTSVQWVYTIIKTVAVDITSKKATNNF